MNRTGLKKLLVAGAFVVALGLCTSAANAGWWWGAGWECGGCCNTGCYSTCNTCGYSSCDPCSGWHGCHHHCYSCGWSYCDPCLTSCGSCYAPVSSCGCSGGSYWGSPIVSSCGCGDTVVVTGSAVLSTTAAAAPTKATIPAAPVTPAESKPAATTPALTLPAATPAPPAAPPVLPGAIPGALTPSGEGAPPIVPPTPSKTSIEQKGENGCLLTVWVPEEAKVTINGRLTKSTGSRRQFVSYGLKPGLSYKYEVKAEIVRERPWSASTTYTENQVVRSQNGGNFYVCVAGGASGTLAPTEPWVGETFHDGSVTWRNVGPDYRGPGYRGMTVTATQTVSLTAGGREGVAFGFNTPPETQTASSY